MRILAIDPAIRKTGYAVIEGDYKDVVALDYGTIELAAKLPQSQCLHAIHEHIHNLILKWQPQEMAIERIIYVQSQQTAIIMGSARAAAILAASRNALQIMEYSPTSVKLAAVGRGSAQKAQVAFMMRALLKLSSTPAPDAADALAVAYTHMIATDPMRAQLRLKRKYI